ncbi:MAG: carbohydrate ABC transporter substrate-binding protein, partial [Bacteroidota bacterium]
MFNKKTYALLAILVVIATVLSACAPKAAATTAPAASSGGGNGKVEVFSWWVGPGEADGLAAMIKIFQQKYPNEEFVNASVAGGAGTNAKAVLATRLQAGDPPDSWQAHAGEATFAYVDAKQIQPLDDFFNSSGFGKALPAALLPLISKDGHPYSVPVNIHRSN